jgi:hypothetical protein
VAGFDYKWRLSTGGDATVATNWAFFTNGDPGPTPPGAADEAEFGNLGGTITGTINVDEWVVDPAAGLYTFAGNTTATFFEIGTSASLTGTWTQTGMGAIQIDTGTFTLGSHAQLISDVTGNTLGLVADGAVIDNGGAITAAAAIGVGVNAAGSMTENSGATLATRNRRTAATPVIVRKGALGPNVPHNDLRITKGHALHIDGVLIPVEFLVNHRSIEWDDRAQEVTIYHVELETYDVLLANGAPAETYRDDGNRWLFQNANTGWQLPPQEPSRRC